MRINESHPPSDIPYEDHHFTKEIVRMGMSALSAAIRSGKNLVDIHHLIKETRPHIHKLKDPEIHAAFDQIHKLIDRHFPISEHTDWDTLQTLGKCFAFIDEKTVY